GDVLPWRGRGLDFAYGIDFQVPSGPRSAAIAEHELKVRAGLPRAAEIYGHGTALFGHRVTRGDGGSDQQYRRRSTETGRTVGRTKHDPAVCPRTAAGGTVIGGAQRHGRIELHRF